MTTHMQARHTRAGEGKALWGPGDTYTFLITGEQTGGACFAMEGLVPSAGGPPPHIHQHEDETLYILEGGCEVEIGEQRLLASAHRHTGITRPHRSTRRRRPRYGLEFFLPSSAEPASAHSAA